MTPLFIFFLIFGAACSDYVERVTVVTSRGPVRGQRANDGNYTTFFGIPYAKVNEDNPFGMSLNYPPFDTPFDASNSTIKCHQVYFSDEGILQCLRLNIYVPKTTNANRKLAVFVWIHGGGFLFGSAGEYGGQYLVQRDIIVVTINYRQGPYGFLCLDDSTVPGNQGLKDQIAALRWIKDNIGAFGGDKDKVTIAGESYGGGSVDIHHYSLYEKLFDKAIVQSGSIYDEAFFVRADRDAAIKLANYLGHNTTNTKDALKFLAKAEPLDVMAATRNLELLLRVCKEKKFKEKNVQNFITTDPFHLTQAQKIKDASILIGYTSKEDFQSFVNKTDEFYTNTFVNKLNFSFVLNQCEFDKLVRIVQTFYLGGKTGSKEYISELSDFSSDLIINYPTEWSVNNYMKYGAGKVYKYLFSYIGGSPYKNITGIGAYHTEELQYLFDWIWSTGPMSEEQIMMRNRMTEMWANFVKTGNPTPEKTELLPVKWVPVSSTTRPYLNIDLKMEMLDHVFHERMSFWELIWLHYWKHSSVLKERPRKQD